LDFWGPSLVWVLHSCPAWMRLFIRFA